MNRIVTIEFPDGRYAEHFMVWLCEIGEQSYFDEIDYGEERKPCGRFNYDFKSRVIIAEEREE
jgi:hypothetical protein